MNKKGSTSIVYFMIGVLFFLLGLALAPALSHTTSEAQTQLDCSNSSISNQDKAICYQVDTFNPLWIGVLFGLGGLILTRIMM